MNVFDVKAFAFLIKLNKCAVASNNLCLEYLFLQRGCSQFLNNEFKVCSINGSLSEVWGRKL